MQPDSNFDPLDPLIKEEVLRGRIRKILDEPTPSWWQSFSRHPLTSIVVGFLFTVVLTQIIKQHQDSRDKANEQREHEYAMQAEVLRQKHISGIAAIELFSEIMYSRLTRSSMLGSALVRNAALPEIEIRKDKLDEAYVKWSVQRHKTYLTLQEIDLQLYPKIKDYDDSLLVHYQKLDSYLTNGYDARKNGKPCIAESKFIKGEASRIQRLSDRMLTTIWATIRPNYTQVTMLQPTASQVSPSR